MIANRIAGGRGRASGRRRSRRTKVEYHRARLEILEPRFALAASLAPLADVTLLAGAPLNVAVHATDPNHEILYYEVSTSNPDVTPTLLDPFDNRSLRISVRYTGKPNDASDDFSGDMVFQLFEQWAPDTTARIVDLAETGGPDHTPFYDGLTFHRIMKNFMIQGGDPKGDGTGGSGVNFDDEFTPDLQFTSSGILAMANSGSDTNDSQFFITAEPTRWLDFKHTIFGFLTSGDDIRQKIAAVPTDADHVPAPAEPTYKPDYTVEITNVRVESDDFNRVLHLAAPAGTTGESTITVKALDFDQEGHQVVVASQSFHVAVAADANNNRPMVDPTNPVRLSDDTTAATLETVAGTPVTFHIQAEDVEGDAIFYGTTADPSATDITVTVDSSTGQATLTPKSGAVGVRAVALGVRKPTPDANDNSPWDTQLVPVYIRPAVPTLTLASESDTGSAHDDGVTSLNNTAAKKLRFSVTGTVSGALVEVAADGVVIGSGTASGTSMTIESNGTYTLTDGPHSLTVVQTLADQTVNVGNLKTTVDLASDESDPTNIVVDTAAPQITSTPPANAVEGEEYAYQAAADDADSEVRYALVASPSGMTVDPDTGLVTWTPQSGGSSGSVTLRVSDEAGNVADQTFTVQVQGINLAPSATEQTVRVLSNGSISITLAGDDGDLDATQILTFALTSNPTHGTISGFNAATGTLTYTPEADYFGPDSFDFTVTDDAAAGAPAALTSEPAAVSIAVAVKNNKPVANAQSVATTEDIAKTVTLTGDDGNTEITQGLTYQIVQQPLHGTLSGFNAATGQITYTPAANYNGPDSFTFTVTDDGQGEPPNLVSDPATVSINVVAVNDSPTATSASVTVGQDTPRSITLTGDDGDPEVTQTLTFTITSQPSHGTLSGFDAVTGKVTYTPAASYSGPDSFSFTVTDDGKAGDPAGSTSAAGTISIQVSSVNNRPVANAQSVATDEDSPLGITLTGDDADEEVQQTLTYAIAGGPRHGTLSGFNPRTGAVRYTPAADFSGSDSFTFTVTDDATAGLPASLTSGAATVSITVNAVDDAPRFLDTPAQRVMQTQTLHVRVQARDVDVPANAIRYSLDPGSPKGMTIDPVAGDITWNVPQTFPAGATSALVRATELTAGGPDGLSSVHRVDILVQDLAAVIAAVLPSAPTVRQSQDTILSPSSSSASFQREPLLLPAGPGTVAALAGLVPSSSPIAASILRSGSRGPLNGFGAPSLFDSPTLGENRLGVDTGFGGGKVVTPEATKQGEQGQPAEKAPPANPQGPQNSTSNPAGADRDAPPASRQSNRSTGRSYDLALELLASESAYYADSADVQEGEELLAEVSE